MPPEPIARLRARAKRRAVWALTRILQRVAGRAPVIVPEYDLDPRAALGLGRRPPARGHRAPRARRGRATSRRSTPCSSWPNGLGRPARRGSGVLRALVGEQLLGRDGRGRPGRPSSAAATHARTWRSARVLDAIRATGGRDFGLRTRVVSIDPDPRAEVDALCDSVLRSRLADLDPAAFDSLEAGDVLLIDGSHMAFMNSDTAVLFVEVLPRLAPGVIVAHPRRLPSLGLPADVGAAALLRAVPPRGLPARRRQGLGGAFPGLARHSRLTARRAARAALGRRREPLRAPRLLVLDGARRASDKRRWRPPAPRRRHAVGDARQVRVQLLGHEEHPLAGRAGRPPRRG